MRRLQGVRTPRLVQQEGFTLIELLMVIIIIAILAALAIPSYLGIRTKAQDNATVTLVRNALTVVESANIGLNDYASLTVADLRAMEPSITWNMASADLVDPSVPTVTANVTADGGTNEVDFYGQGGDVFDVASVSASGNRYGIEVRTAADAATSYVKVRVVEGDSSLGW